ncbi:MAG: caspase family protein, partial [Armatimonadetes bacterium]|nr:caspase family protein [Armatimonadota bacterium]
GHAFSVSSAVYSADGRRILTSAWDHTARVWDAGTGRELMKLEGHSWGVPSAVYSADGRRILTSSWDKTARVWDAGTGRELMKLEGHSDDVNSAVYSADGRRILTSSRDKTARVWDAGTGRELMKLEGHSGRVFSAVYSADGRRILTSSWDHTARVWDAGTGRELMMLEGHSHFVSSAVYSADGRRILTSSWDQTSRIWDSVTGKQLCSLISFTDGTWAVVDPDGRYDASNGGDIQGLHWVYSDPKNHILEPIELSQFKDLYYDPGLLAKKLGFSPEKPRQVPDIKSVKLFPTAKATLSSNHQSAHVEIAEQAGGGIGAYKVFLNGSQIFEGKAPPGVKKHTLDLDLRPYSKRLIPKDDLAKGQSNKLEVFAYNGANSLSSRGVEVEVPAPATKGGPPKLFIVAAGCSDYEGEALDLKYAAKDAVDFAKALTFASTNLLGADRVETTILATGKAVTGYEEASNENIRSLLTALKSKASATDTVVLYLSGHGVARAGEDSDYYYLTKESGLANLDRPETRSQLAISGKELADLLAAIPANKKVLILDTCASGAAAPDLTKGQDVGSDIKRAWERLKDHAGVYVLAGCAASSVSYEATNVRQGLLTYSLLEPLNKVDPQVLKLTPEGSYQLEVLPWLSYSEQRVGELIQQLQLSGSQKPELKPAARAQSFPVGQLSKSDAGKITLEQPKKVVLMRDFENAEREDPLRLSFAMDEALTKASAEGAYGMIYWPTVRDHPTAHVLRGEYLEKDGVVSLKVFVQAYVTGADGQKSRKTVKEFSVAGSKDKLAELCKTVLAQAGKELWAPNPTASKVSLR